MDESSPPKQPQPTVITSEDIERQTREFLAKGGQIEKLPSKRKAPRHLKWIADHGMDFTPWEKL